MTLAPGTRIGAYEVTAPLGEGGMGAVYRARDTKLDRDVALKILPEAFVHDADRVTRFTREAKTLAALNHPHIAAIYGLEESAGTTALVMELVEGEDLSQRLARGHIPVQEALPVARQIAEALEAAHEQGIVHRDLKPANIKLKVRGVPPPRTEDGGLEPRLSGADVGDCTVKVLDFGLAKAIEPVNALSPGASQAPTITTPAMTQAGMILGTAAYMAPEQARGKPVDRRADIWAFGCVLYEMLTGARAFGGEDVTDTLAAVVRAEPDWSRLPADLPPTLAAYLKRCLQKDPRQRVADMQDVRLALDGAFDIAAPGAAAPTPRPRRTPLIGVGVAGLAIGALAAGAAVWSWGTRASVQAGVERLSVMTPANRPAESGGYIGSPNRMLALSADGAQLVYVARQADVPIGRMGPDDGQPGSPTMGLALRSLATREVRDLPGTTDARQPFFSPDGRWVAFFAGETGALKKVALSGGNPVTIVEGINGSQWAFGVWLDDGTIVFDRWPSGGLRRVSADGGQATELTTLDAAAGETYHVHPAVVPSTRVVLFTVVARIDTSRIEAVRVDTGERHVVIDNAWGPLVLNGEYLLFQREDTILVAPLDVGSLTVTGPAVPLAEDIAVDNPARVRPNVELAVSRDGALAYIPARVNSRAMGLVGRDGTFQPLGIPPPLNWPRVAPDGQAVAYIEFQGADSTVRIHDLARGSTTRLGEKGNFRGAAVWQPDGRSLAVGGTKGGESGIFQFGLDDGSERLLATAPRATVRSVAWSPDGKQLAYTTQVGNLHDIWIRTLDGEPPGEPWLHSPASEFNPAFSPDGKWLAYVSDESGRDEVYVQQYPKGARFPVSVGGGSSPVWGRDGRELFFAGAEGGLPRMMAVSVTPDGTSLRLGRPVALFDLRVGGPSGEFEAYDTGSNGGAGYEVLPDGRFVMIRYLDQSTTREIVLVRNWLDELKRLVPAN